MWKVKEKIGRLYNYSLPCIGLHSLEVMNKFNIPLLNLEWDIPKVYVVILELYNNIIKVILFELEVKGRNHLRVMIIIFNSGMPYLV
jgi:hypothetical protein